MSTFYQINMNDEFMSWIKKTSFARCESFIDIRLYRFNFYLYIYLFIFEELRFIFYLLTYFLTPWCRVLLEQLTGLHLVKTFVYLFIFEELRFIIYLLTYSMVQSPSWEAKFPAFHGTRRFITALTSLGHPSVSWASPIQTI